MKKLKLDNMETIHAGNFMDGFCMAVGAISIGGALGVTLVTGGFGTGLLVAADIGCFVRQFY